MENPEGRPPRERLVCVDCGRDSDPADAVELRRPKSVMKVCPKCLGAVRVVTDDVLGYGPSGRVLKEEEP